MANESSGGRKAFESKSVTIHVLKIFLVVLGLFVLAGVGVRFLLPGQWDKGSAWALEQVDGPMLDLFQKLGKQYVEGSDLDKDGKQRWGGRFDALTTVLRTGKGTDEQRKDLRTIHDGLADRMRDGALSRSELEPFEKPLDEALSKIDATEAKMKEK
jgi:hypothetical protein